MVPALNTAARRFVIGMLTAFAATSAWAHTGSHLGMASFGAGFLHPILGGDHMLAMLAVGLWATQQRRALAWALPMAFPLMMILGAILAYAGLILPATEQGIAVSVAVLGLLVAFAIKMPAQVGLPLISAFAVLHGYAHGAELPTESSVMLYGAGFVASTVLLHLAGVGFGMRAESMLKNRIIRATGSVMALCGVFLLARAV